MVADNKPKILSIHAPHIHKGDAKIELLQLWNDHFGHFNQSHVPSEDGGVAKCQRFFFLTKYLNNTTPTD
jgi:hypothetical protein